MASGRHGKRSDRVISHAAPACAGFSETDSHLMVCSCQMLSIFQHLDQAIRMQTFAVLHFRQDELTIQQCLEQFDFCD